jgi:hypothetical protein
MQTRILVSMAAVLALVCACQDRGESAGASAEEARDSAAATAVAVQQWNTISRTLPPLLDLVSERIERQKRMGEAGQEQLASTRAELADMRARWLEATSAFASGEAVMAIEIASALDRRARDTLRLLGLELAPTNVTVAPATVTSVR